MQSRIGRVITLMLVLGTGGTVFGDQTVSRKTTYAGGLGVALDLGGNKASNVTEVVGTGGTYAGTNLSFRLPNGEVTANLSTFKLRGLYDGNDLDPGWTLDWSKYSTARASISALGFFQASVDSWWNGSSDDATVGDSNEKPSLTPYQLRSGDAVMLDWTTPARFRVTLASNGVFSSSGVAAWDSEFDLPFSSVLPTNVTISPGTYQLRAGTNVMLNWSSKKKMLGSLTKVGVITNAADAPLAGTLDFAGHEATNVAAITVGTGTNAVRLEVTGGANVTVKLGRTGGTLLTTNELADVVRALLYSVHTGPMSPAGYDAVTNRAVTPAGVMQMLTNSGSEAISPTFKQVRISDFVGSGNGAFLGHDVDEFGEETMKLGGVWFGYTNPVTSPLGLSLLGVQPGTLATREWSTNANVANVANQNWNANNYSATNLNSVALGQPVPGTGEGARLTKAGLELALPGADTNFVGRFTRDSIRNERFAVTNQGQMTVRFPSGATATLRFEDAGQQIVDFPSGNGTIAYQAWVRGLMLTNSASLDFGSTASMGSSEQTIGVTGASPGDCIVLGLPDLSTAAFGTNFVFNAYCTGSGVVRVRWQNLSAVTVDPAPATFKVTVLK